MEASQAISQNTVRSAENPKEKIPLRKWQGIFAGRPKTYRIIMFAFLAIVCFALTFTQLGFAGIGLPGEYVAYAVTLLFPIALTSAILGFGRGTLMGVIAGAILCVHSMFMPLDYYELTFVTPFSSIFQLAASGFLTDLSYALIMRKKRHVIFYVIWVVLASIIISWLYTIGFFINMVVVVVLGLADAGVGQYGDEQISVYGEQALSRAMAQMGDISIQAWIDALMMALVALLAHFLEPFSDKFTEKHTIRFVFKTRLAFVVAFTFLITASVCFVAVTHANLGTAEDNTFEEIAYLEEQSSLSVSNGGQYTIDDILAGYSLEDDGYIMICDANDMTIKHSDFDLSGEGIENPTVADVFGLSAQATILKAAETGNLARVVCLLGADGSVIISSVEQLKDGEENRIYADMGYAVAKKDGDTLYAIVLSASKVHANRGPAMALLTFAIAVLLIAVSILTTRLLRDVVVRRVEDINGSLEEITSGHLDEEVGEQSTIEFDELADGINTTVDALKGWIHEAESRIDSELAAARAIQASALPQVFPPFPNIMHFDIYASMKPAREVGGDFYDFFLIGDNDDDRGRLGFVIADVSGKGIPAALFMMNAKALVKSYIESGMAIGEAIENANRQLCEGNDASMFVTLFAGVLDYGTGHIDYVNAGHNPPLLWRHEGGWRWLEEKSGLPLGLFDGLPYKQFSMDCEVGEMLLLYTDGVTEAMNNDAELFGEERLMALAEVSYPLHPRDLVGAVKDGVAGFADGAEQSDDITILALEVGVPPEITEVVTFSAKLEALYDVNDFIHRELDKRFCPKRTQNAIDLAIEELFANQCLYAYPEDVPEERRVVRISYTYLAEPPSIEITLADDGVPYDPTAKEDVALPTTVDEMEIGGLGIFMSKQLVDMSYERSGGSNVLTIKKSW